MILGKLLGLYWYTLIGLISLLIGLFFLDGDESFYTFHLVGVSHFEHREIHTPYGASLCRGMIRGTVSP